jgi:hypothetical protein
MEQNFILSYAANSGKGTNILRNYLDSTHQTTRITFEMVDVGSARMNKVIEKLHPR